MPFSCRWIPAKPTFIPLFIQLPLRYNLTPIFIGVIFERTLSKHVSSLKGKFFPRRKVLRSIFCFFMGPLLTYALPGWFPFLSVTNAIKLQRLHRAASRTITGNLSSCPIPLIHAEAFLPPLRVILTHFTLLYERAFRLPTSSFHFQFDDT